jgi:tRNA threonylcarbamoyladenosine biosynthesis protein TsaE
MEWQFTLENIDDIARETWKAGTGFNVYALHGPMGAGKTTFVHALCKVKGVTDVTGSPTFSIINEYEMDCEGIRRPLFHIDLYRLKDENEARQAGVEDCLHSGYSCLVEWPEKAPGIFPEKVLHLYLELVDDKTRLLRIGGN